MVRILLLLVTLASALSAHLAYAAEPVKIGVLAYKAKEKTQAQWQPLAEALNKALPDYHFEVEALDLHELEWATESRQVDFVLTNPGHYVKLHYEFGLAVPLATLATHELGDGETVFGGVIFSLAKQTELNSLSDIKGKTIAVVHKRSFGGYQMQAYEFHRVGVDLTRDVKLLETGIPQDNVVNAVLNGRAEVGFVRTGVLEEMAREGKLDLAKIKVLNLQDFVDFPVKLSTRLYPEWAFAAMPNVDENLARRVAAFLYGVEEDGPLVNALGIHGFSVPADYTPVSDVLKTLRIKPFDTIPEFTLYDVWERYRWQMLLGVFALGLILFQTIRLLIIKRELQKNHQQLKENENKLSLILDSVDACIYLKDQQGRYLFANRSVRDLFGKKMEEIVGQMDAMFFDKATAEQIIVDDRVVLDQGRTFKTEETNLNLKDGVASTYVTVKLPLLNDAGDIYALCGISTDITERKKAEESLQLYAQVYTHAREGIMIADVDGTIVDVNEALIRLTGYSREELVGQNPRMLSSGRQDKAFYDTMWHTLNERGYWSGEIWNRRKTGEFYAEMKTISAVRDATGKVKHYLALCSDITALKEHAHQLEHIAHYDALTNLPNRVLLADRLHQSMIQAQRRGCLLAVAFLDLDGFKSINDRYGHDAGDQLLIAISAKMKQTLRDGDTLSRIGGDEFVAVLLDLANPEASIPMLSRLLTAAAEPVNVDGNVLQVSASLGVTFYPQAQDIDADQLQRQADQAMYQAKQAGKNRYYVFDAEQDNSVRSLHESLDRIRRALVEREFVLYYQPKVNMRTGAVIGAEALIRWQHPEKGLLPPSVFLPVIEEHPLSVELGEWVIDSALSQIEVWYAAGLVIPVSVNVGARQLQQVNFVERLHEILAAHPNVSPSSLELELLETSALEDMVQVSQTINRCHMMGVEFALDDFGTGYSSLSYLKRLPVSMLKIDKSFVRDMLDDPDDLAILEGVISLAEAFQREVIAEGVETVEHGSVLLKLGCDLAQGYGIARPMPAEKIPEWAAAWRPDVSWGHQASLNRADFPLLFAGVQHRAWMVAIEHYLKGERDQPVNLDHRECYVGKWLAGDGALKHRHLPCFPIVQDLHQRAHVLATRLCQLKSLGQDDLALAGVSELHEICDTLLAKLDEMLPA